MTFKCKIDIDSIVNCRRPAKTKFTGEVAIKQRIKDSSPQRKTHAQRFGFRCGCGGTAVNGNL